MEIWTKSMNVDELNTLSHSTLMASLGIKFTQLGENFLEGTIPVDPRTVQPMGILHGGASAALAETLASSAAYLAAPEGKVVVGVELNINHLKPCRQGLVTGRTEPLRLGGTVQVWEIRLRDEQGDLTAVSRMTAAVRDVRR